MWHCSFFAFLFFFLIIPQQNCSPVTSPPADLINTTCKQCADKYPTTFSYDFCTTSLEPIPISHVTNLQGLALIAMELALENATNTISKIERLLSSGEFDTFTLWCLKDCMELYRDGVSMLVTSIGVFMIEQYDVADLLLSAVVETASTCEDGFKERQGEAFPLTAQNDNLSQLGDIALCIINLLSVALNL
ncbi:putative invertase inhibitor [Actinidia eriantha]|uniref:putative invertase inhibitor n=1 Tax=Actinidia eriantha TaxID=165200 RepID=UPI00258342A6|nr:putative invertase inhibitor [Actinidia eriantha]